jgi:hypothetical protein
MFDLPVHEISELICKTPERRPAKSLEVSVSNCNVSEARACRKLTDVLLF